MSLYQTLEQQLKKEPNFVTDNGELKKWVLLNKAQNFDEEPIELLLQKWRYARQSIEEIKTSFGQESKVLNGILMKSRYINSSYIKILKLG